ncbi:efflux RND transporter periplasmic adaptor subunit [Spirochaeta isovalerica]|uniref:Multidrug efflux pump subunit AcrA (Membrane-fusion protein) n=1 Tax=Spirochaeta isovalerica TaxID=150 RepID=A0A841RC93_9SPIO|nr:HlyD family efflux transporter periplasmic adaptor subunit [Spirochaeta isovalerica]MBB6481001.1 multidrug efflux pump subunit AcrA (membrane-fusion protein) [Spirochaeta isovalerica]
MGRRISLKLFNLFFLLIIISPVTAQFGGPGRNNSNGIIAVAGAAGTDRVITVGGRLTPLRKITHSISVEGYVDAILVKQGDRVSPGSPLARISRDVIGESYRPVILESRISGIVSQIHIYENESVRSGAEAVTVLDDRSYLLKVSLSDRDAPAVRRLGALPVQGMTPEGQSFRGRIESLSTEPDYNTGLFTLTISFPRSSDLYLGTVLFVDLPVEKASGIAIESSAVIREEGKAYVWIIDDQGLIRKQAVVAGDISEENIEIKEGIAEGTRYIRTPSGEEKPDMSIRELIQATMSGNAAPGGN